MSEAINSKIDTKHSVSQCDPTDCAICCEDFNKSTRKCVKCPYCDYCACKSCVRQYLTTSTKDPHCMNCKKGWSQHFVVLQLDRSFNTKEYRTHRKGLLLESEISKLPETMEAAENYKKKEELHEENRKLKQIENDLKEQLRNITDTYYTNQHTIYRIERGDYKKGEEKKKFMMPCPEEGCRGFLSSAYKCELCKLYTCPKCHEVIGDKKDNPDHVCNPDSVKSAEMIKKETKPCPSCGCRIYKIDGCDQMWCTTCHVAFSWRTGRRETGTIHNPHFYQWQRDANNGQAPRVPGDNPCGVDLNHMPNWWNFRSNFIRTLNDDHFDNNYVTVRNFIVPNPFTEEEYDSRQINFNAIKRAFIDYITETFRRINEIIYQKERLDYRIENLGNNQQIRVDYLLKKISKEEMATKVFRNDNMRRKLVEMRNLYDILATVGRETFHFITQQDIKTESTAFEECCERLLALSNLRTYCNKQFEEISISYNVMVPFIDMRWNEEKKKYKLADARAKSSRSKSERKTQSKPINKKIKLKYVKKVEHVDKFSESTDSSSAYTPSESSESGFGEGFGEGNGEGEGEGENIKYTELTLSQAVIEDNKNLAVRLARDSGKSSQSDTLEGRVLQGDWDQAKNLAEQRVNVALEEFEKSTEKNPEDNCVTS